MRLANRLETARRRSFVGRKSQRELFESILSAGELPFCVLHIFGPGGVGKTTLLQEFIAMTHRAGVYPIYVDGSHINHAPASFMAALRDRMQLRPSKSPLDVMDSSERRYILFIDTYEQLAPLDDWLRELFLPQLPATVFVVLAGRQQPSLPWRTDLGWQSLLRCLPLGHLSQLESCTYLNKHHIPSAQQQAVLDFASGHPLALSLVADLFKQRPNINFLPQEEPDIIRCLLSQLVQKVPSPAHRMALETCGVARFTTESLLSIALEQEDVHKYFEWLCNLPFIESDKNGLFPHEFVRQAITSDLRWRHIKRYTELHERVRAYYARRLEETSGKAQRRVLMDYNHLQRDNPIWKPFFDWQERETVWIEGLQREDIPALVAMVAQHEGISSAKLAGDWLTRFSSPNPEEAKGGRLLVFRNASPQPVGFMLLILLNELTAEALNCDPASKAAWAYLQAHAPLRSGEKASLVRFWMAGESYQEVSAIQTHVFLNATQHYLTTAGLAFSFFSCAKPDFWAPAFAYMDFNRLPEAEYEVSEKHYGIYGHDWRAMPPTAWLKMLAKREMGMMHESMPPPTSVESFIVLDEETFREAVREALRHYTSPDELTCNPLLRSRLVIDQSNSEISAHERITSLRRLLKEVINCLQLTPRDIKYYRALYHTYLQPAPTQEKAAELLDLPFSTYRRHLKKGGERIISLLWQREIRAEKS